MAERMDPVKGEPTHGPECHGPPDPGHGPAGNDNHAADAGASNGEGAPSRGSYGARKVQVLRRLRRIEGQVRGLQRMVAEEKYCVDVLNQIAAVKAALDRVGLLLLEDHTRGCVARALRAGDREAERSIRELTDVILRFLREA